MQSQERKRPFASLLALTLLITFVPLVNLADGALALRQYSPARHDRFYAGPDKAFVGDAYNWSGVGRRTDNQAHWATMISPSYFISANHYHPGTNHTLRFYHGNDPAGTYEDRTVQGGSRIGSTDLWVGRLTESVSDDVATYSVLIHPDTSYYEDQVMFIFGRSNTSPSHTNMRMGRNELNYVSGTHLWWSYDDPGLGPDECMTQSGDSGGGSFMVYDDQPMLLGIHHYVNGDTFVPFYIDEINAILAAGGESLSVARVPEPTTGWLAASSMMLAAALIRRRRGRAFRRTR